MTELATIPIPGSDAALVATLIDGKPYVALKPLCDAIGIAYPTQSEKLKGRSWATITQRVTVAADGKSREMMMIDRRTMTMWLATIDENRVAEAARHTVRAFQAEAADALDAYFHDGQAINPRGNLSTFDVLRAQIDQIEAAHRTAEEAKVIATKTDARLDAIEGRHGWFAALGYARAHGIENTSAQYLNKVGRQASMIAKAHGIAPEKIEHSLFGKVNSYPAWVWEMAFDGRGVE